DPGSDATLQEQAARGSTALAGSPDRPEQDGAQHQVRIGIVHHNDSVVPSQLQDRPSQPLGYYPGYMPSHFGRTGEADQRDTAVSNGSLRDGLAGPNHEVEDALDSVPVEHAIANFLYGDGGERRFRRGAPQHTISADRGDHCVPRPHGHREIERADDAHD